MEFDTKRKCDDAECESVSFVFCILSRFYRYFETSDLQRGFKANNNNKKNNNNVVKHFHCCAVQFIITGGRSSTSVNGDIAIQ